MILRETALVLLRYMRLNESQNEVELLQVVEICKDVFGAAIEPELYKIMSFIPLPLQ